MVEGIPKQVSVRQILTLQLRKFYKKGCQLYATHISYHLKDKGPNIEDYQLFKELKYVFPDEVSALPPKKDIDFTIDLVPWDRPFPNILID